MVTKPDFRHANCLWGSELEDQLGKGQIQLLLYKSNLLGVDLQITKFGGEMYSAYTR